MLGLVSRALSGNGCFVEVSHQEAVSTLACDAVIRSQLSAKMRGLSGSVDAPCASCDAYRCAGDDRRIAIAVRSPEEWRALRAVIGRPDLAATDGLQSVEGRRVAHGRIDEAITRWTMARAVVQHEEDIPLDGYMPLLQHRQFVEEVRRGLARPQHLDPAATVVPDAAGDRTAAIPPRRRDRRLLPPPMPHPA